MNQAPPAVSVEEIYAAALDYHSRHWCCIPIRRGKEKKPYVKWKEYQSHLPTDLELEMWFLLPERNVGIVTGAISRFFALDIDGEAGFRAIESQGGVPDTVSMRSQVGHEQRWFRLPDFRVANAQKFLPGLDLRGEGGYVQAPPSIHHSGSQYVFTRHPDEVELAEAPEWLLSFARKKEKQLAANSEPVQLVELNGTATGDRVRDYCWAALCGEARKIAAMGDGERHGQRLRSAIALGGFVPLGGLTEDEIADNLLINVGADTKNAADTIRDGIRYGIERPRSIPDLKPTRQRVLATVRAAESEAVQGEDGRPLIDAYDSDLPVPTAQSWDALVARNDPPLLFRSGRQCVRLEHDEDGTPILRDLSVQRLRHELVNAALFYRWRPEGRGDSKEMVQQPCQPPDKLVENLLAVPCPPLPVLTRIVEAPVFAPDGSLQTEPGYHAGSRTFYQRATGFDIPAVPGVPSPRAVAQAVQLLAEDLIGEFPFVSQSEKANALGLMLLPYARDLIAGPTPLHMIEAPAVGSGKGLLAHVLVSPCIGHEAGVVTECGNEEEWRKRITAVLREGYAAVQIDNINKTLNSGTLAGALTMRYWSDRLLGGNSMVNLPVRCVWLATANNPVLSTEIARRTIRIRLDPKQDRAWQRTGFKKEKLSVWAQQNRAELVWSCLVIVRSWIAAGCPMGNVVLGSYEDWAAVMGGILSNAGIEGFLGNLNAFYEVADTEGGIWRQFVNLWWTRYEDREVTAADLFTLASEVDDFPMGKSDKERGRRTAFGMALGKQRDRVIGDYRIVDTGAVIHHARYWQLLRATPAVGCEDGEAE